MRFAFIFESSPSNDAVDAQNAARQAAAQAADAATLFCGGGSGIDIGWVRNDAVDVVVAVENRRFFVSYTTIGDW